MTARAPLVDAFFTVPRAARALRAGAAVVALRALPLEGSGDGDFGPPPVEPARLLLTKGTATASLDDAAVEIRAVQTRIRSLGWSFDRFCASAVVELEVAGEARELLIAQTICEDEATASAEVTELALAFESYLCLARAETSPEEGRPASDLEADSGPTEEAADRYSLRLEGDALVLRDHRSRGPRERAGRYRWLALIALGLGGVGAAAFSQAWSAGAPVSTLLGFGVVPIVLWIGAFALNEIARHANRYKASSAPLAWFANDRVVVAPWVARNGAIVTRPEGRLGAALSSGEILDVQLHEREGVFAVTLEGLHGPMEVMLTTSQQDGQHYVRVLKDVLTRVRSPKKKVTPLMRAASARQQQGSS